MKFQNPPPAIASQLAGVAGAAIFNDLMFIFKMD
jgi:hypothetical protein